MGKPGKRLGHELNSDERAGQSYCRPSCRSAALVAMSRGPLRLLELRHVHLQVGAGLREVAVAHELGDILDRQVPLAAEM